MTTAEMVAELRRIADDLEETPEFEVCACNLEAILDVVYEALDEALDEEDLDNE
jgi:hypothetical protein